MCGRPLFVCGASVLVLVLVSVFVWCPKTKLALPPPPSDDRVFSRERYLGFVRYLFLSLGCTRAGSGLVVGTYIYVFLFIFVDQSRLIPMIDV